MLDSIKFCNVDDIVLFVQPAYNYRTQKIEYAEILIRRYKEFNTVEGILDYVKSNNLTKELDFNVIKHTLESLNNYSKLTYPIGVNLCPETINQKGIAGEIIDLINKTNKHGNEIIIEVNEKTDFKDKVVRRNISELKDAGIRIALDDFGMDSANFYCLMSCDIDILKVDKAFIDTTKIKYKDSQNKILRRLLEICKDLRLEHIIEGIETKKQLDTIEKIGYDVVQGFLYEKPVELNRYLDEVEQICCSQRA